MSSRKERKRRHYTRDFASIDKEQIEKDYQEKQRMYEESEKIRFLARQINASVPAELMEKRKGLNDVQIILCSQIEAQLNYTSEFGLMMERIWRNVIDLKRRHAA